jgi:tetratricopeptide (TPR) repeat protein
VNLPRPIRTLVFGLFLSCAAAISAAGAPIARRTVEEAEQAYRAGDYDLALERYREVAQHAPHDPDVLYNLGTVHARMGDRGRATWRYLQALRLDPRDRALQHNLALVDPDFQRDLAVTPIPPLNAIYWRLTANEWTAAAVGATLAGLLLLALYFWTSSGRASGATGRVARRSARQLAIVAFAASALAWPPALLRHRQEKMLWRGVVVAAGTVARTDPNEKAFENFALPAGKIVRILDQPATGWLKIGFADDRIGFVQRDRIEFL